MVEDGADLSLLPPCWSSLQMHVQRVNYVAYLWKQSHVAYPHIPSPVGLGWKADAEGQLHIEWTHCDIMPQTLIDVMIPDSAAVVSEDSVEEDYEVDNMLDIVFDDDVEADRTVQFSAVQFSS